MFTRAMHYHIEPDLDGRSDHTCIDEMEDLSKIIEYQLKRVVTAYMDNSLESLKRAIQIEMPALNQIYISMMQTPCGKVIFSESAENSLHNANDALKNAIVTLDQFSEQNNITLVYINDVIDIGLQLEVARVHLEYILDAQENG